MLVDVGGKDLVMAKNDDGDTALHYLCYNINDHSKVVNKIKLLLEVGDANVLLSTKGNDGKTPLEIATMMCASNKIKILLTPQSNFNSTNNSSNSSSIATVVPADNGSDDASPTQQSNHTSQTSSANNNLNGTVHKLQAQLKEALHLAGALTLKTKEVFQSERMNADLQKKNKNLGKKITDLEQSVDSKEADIACMSKQKERDDKDIAYWKEQVAKKTQICSEQKAKIQEMEMEAAASSAAHVGGTQIKREDACAAHIKELEQSNKKATDLEHEVETQRVANAALSEQKDDIEKEYVDEVDKLTQICSKQKAELQQLNQSISTVGTKRKHDNDKEHEDEDCSVTISQSSKRSKVGKASNSTSAVAIHANRAKDDDEDMIAEQLEQYTKLMKMNTERLEQYTKLMTRYLDTRRELHCAKAQIIRLKELI